MTGNPNHNVIVRPPHQHLTPSTRILHNIIGYTLAPKSGHFNEVSAVDFYLLSHLIQGSPIDLSCVIFYLMVSTLTHRTHHLPYAPIITMILLEAEISLLDELDVEIINDTYSAVNLRAMGFRQQGVVWKHLTEMVSSEDDDVGGLGPDVDFDIERQTSNASDDDVVASGVGGDVDYDEEDEDRLDGQDDQESFMLQARAMGKRPKIATRASSSTKLAGASAVDPISVLSSELASLRADVQDGIADVHASIADLRTMIMGGLAEILHRLPPPS